MNLFLVYATPVKYPSIILLALKHCRLFRLIKTWLDPVTAAKIQVIGALVISLMATRNPANSPVWSVEVGRKIPIIIPTGFGIHRRWLALGFLNHQQYYVETYEPEKSPWSPKLWAFWKPMDHDLGKTDSLLKNIMLGGFNRFNLKRGDPELLFF